MIEGKTESYMRDKGISQADIEKAREFKDRYAGHDIFPVVVARELDISPSSAKRMQDIYSSIHPF
jgi:hypothetical protein